MALRDALPDYMQPTAITVLAALPLTVSGKVDRRALVAMDSAPAAADRPVVAPRSETERMLAAVWREVLGMAQIGANDNFFELGGDSILSLQVVSRARKAGVRITVRQLFEHQTVAALAAVAQPAGAHEQQAAVTGEVPPTPIQAWFHAVHGAADHFNQAVMLSLPAAVDVPALATALQALVDHHDMLRLRSSAPFVQTIAPPGVAVPLEIWGPGDAQERRAALARAQAGLSLRDGPVFRALLLRGAGGEDRLLLVAHHLVVDAVSWTILAEDFSAAYDQAAGGISIALPARTTSFKTWAKRLAALAASPQIAAERPYWDALCAGGPKSPADGPEPLSVESGGESVRVALGPDHTAALRQALRGFGVKPEAALLAALLLAARRSHQVDELLVDVESHGRADLFDDLDLSRTVGWFTSIRPARIALDGDDDPDRLLTRIGAHLTEAPHQGLGCGLLDLAAGAPRPQADILVNHLGELPSAAGAGQGMRLCDEPVGPLIGPGLRRSHGIEINALVADGELRIDLGYDSARFRRARMEALVAAFRDALVVLAGCRPAAPLLSATEHFPEKWTPVFRQEMRPHTGSGALPDSTESGSAPARLSPGERDSLTAEAGSDIIDLLPLSPVQQGILAHALERPDDDVYFDQLCFSLSGPIDAARWRASWQALVARHEILRASVHWRGLAEPRQAVHADAALAWAEEDWHGLDGDAVERRLAERLAADRMLGFDLARPPLMRLRLIRLAATRALFIHSAHHLILDGWSLSILLHEVFALYRRPVAGALQPAPRFAGYLSWLARQDGAAAQAFWRGELAGFPGPTVVAQPGLAPGPDEPAPAMIRQLVLGAAETRRLGTFARAAHVTLSLLVQSAWAILLGRYGGSADITFGVTVAGRPADLAGSEAMVGMLINTIPVRMRLDEGMPAQSWLARQRERQAAREAFAFHPLTDIRRAAGVAPGTPLFDSLVLFQNYPVDEMLETDGLRIDSVAVHERTPYALTLVCMPRRELELQLHSAPGLFAATALERMLAHLRNLLLAMAADPQRPLGRLTMLDSAERAALVAPPHEQILFDGTSSPRDSSFSHGEKGRAAARRPQERRWDEGLRPIDGPEPPQPRAALAGADPLPSGEREKSRAIGKGSRPTDAPRVLARVEPWLAPAIVDDWAWRSPDAPAVITGGSTMTYAALSAASNRLAHWLLARGVAAERPVGLCLGRSTDLVVAILGVLKAGGSFLALDPGYPRERIAFMLEDSSAALVLTERALADAVPPLAPIHVLEECAAEIAGAPDTAPALRLDPARTAYLVYTSGSTGRPKGVANLQGGLANLIANQRPLFGLGAGDRVLQFASLSFDASVWEIFMALGSGAALCMAAAEEIQPGPPLTKFLRESRITAVTLPPSALGALAAEDLPDLKILVVAGESCPPGLIGRWAPGRRFFNAYGPSEATVCATVAELAVDARDAPIGLPLAQCQALVLDPRLEPVPVGVAGELCIGGAGLARGYVRRPGRTAETFIPHPFGPPGSRLYRTGDRVFRRRDGRLQFVDRIDRQVKIRGFRIEPGEIEAALTEFPGAGNVAVLVAESAAGDRRLIAHLQAPGASPDEVRDFLAARLPAHMVPALIAIHDALPLTPSAKIDRRALAGWTAPDHSPAEAGGAPRGALEAQLCAIFAETLGLPGVGIHDRFYSLGGDSIMAIQVVAKANATGIGITMQQVLDEATQTVAELVRLATADPSPQAAEPEAADAAAGPIPLSPIQHWFFDLGSPEPHHYNQALLLEVPAGIDATALAAAAQALLRLHAALRLRFVREESGWQASVAPPDERDCLALCDLSTLDMAEARARLDQEAARWQCQFDLAAGALLRLVLFRMPDGPDRLLCVAHHLAIDAVSWAILLDDLFAGYARGQRDNQIRLAVGPQSYRRWLAALAAHVASDEARAELRFWQSLAWPVQGLPRTASPSPNTVGDAVTLTRTLDAAATAALVARAGRDLQGHVDEILIAALAGAVGEIAGSEAVALDIESHGRALADCDLTRTIGWFTALAPAVISLSSAASPAQRLAAVRMAVRERPQGGATFGALRYLSPDPAVRNALAALPARDIAFNYLGQWNSNWPVAVPVKLAAESIGPSFSPTQPRAHALEINAAIVDGGLRIEWAYNPAIHAPALIERLAERFVASLDALVEPFAGPSAAAAPAFGLTPSQDGMLDHISRHPSSEAYKVQLTAGFSGDLDLEAFKQAWQVVIGRHAALRARFAVVVEGEGGAPRQHLDSDAQPGWREVDGRGLAEPDFLQLADRIAGEERDALTPLRAPLMRFALVRDTGGGRFVWTCHHLLLDGWSLPLIVGELEAAYGARCAGRLPDLPDAPDFGDYLDWLARQDGAAAKNFWRAELAGIGDAHALWPSRTAPGARASFCFAERPHAFPAPLGDALASAAKSARLTLSSLLLTAWAVLLARRTGASTVAFGVTSAMRPPDLAGSDRMVGPLIATGPLHVPVEPERLVRDWALALQRRRAAQLPHLHLPLAAMADVAGLSADGIIGSSLRIQNYPLRENHASALPLQEPRIRDVWHYPLSLEFVPGTPLRAVVTYDRGLHRDEDIDALAAELTDIITSMVRDVSAPLHTLLAL